MNFVKLPLSVDKITVRQLTSEIDIQKAQRLLYDTYVDELGWQPPEAGRSGQKIQINAEGKYLLTDEFKAKAMWFGAMDEERCIGCFRVIPPPIRN